MRAPAAAVAVLALLLAGCASAPPPDGGPWPPGPPGQPAATLNLSRQFVHEHASFALWILGERVSFNHTDHDLSRVRNVTAHLHIGERDGEHVVHVEGPFPGGVHDVALADFFRIHGIAFAHGALTLGTRGGHNGTAWNDTADRRWEVHVQPRDGAWALAAEGPAHRLREGERVLVTFGALPSQLDAQKESVPPPPSPARRGNVTGPA